MKVVYDEKYRAVYSSDPASMPGRLIRAIQIEKMRKTSFFITLNQVMSLQ